MRKPHYWRKAKACSAPTEIIVVDTESHFGDDVRVEGGELHTLRLGCALAYRYERGKRTRIAELDFTDAGSFWAFVERRLARGRTTYIVGHNLAYDLGILSGWRWLGGSRVHVEKHVIEGGILLITGFHTGRKFVLVDTFNWFKCSLAAIGEANGVPKMDMPSQAADDYAWFAYCRRDVDATAAGIDSLIRYVVENELGPWQPTIASLAFSVFRHRFMGQKVLVHSCKPALLLERAGYYGGIVDTPLVGRTIPGPIHECDVVSMYPSVCCGDLPYQLAGVLNRPSPSDLAGRLKDYVCIADVEIRTTDVTYPIRSGHNVYHVTGQFRTVLADGELRRAVASGAVVKCFTVCWYRKCPLFRDYMLHFMAEKSKHRAAGNYADEMIAKYLGNSLYGKTGQLSPRWLPWGEHSLSVAEELHGLEPGTLTRRADNPPTLYDPEITWILPYGKMTFPVRQYWGEIEICVGRTESRDSVPSIAACVTSGARVQLQGYQNTAGKGHYFYSDTDSVWVDDVGLSRLTVNGNIAPGVLGKLDVKRTVDSLLVHGRKDYEFPGGRKTKGRKKTARDLSESTFAQLHFPSAKSQIADGPWGGVLVREAIKTLRRTVDWCHVGAGGVTSPFVLPVDGNFL